MFNERFYGAINSAEEPLDDILYDTETLEVSVGTSKEAQDISIPDTEKIQTATRIGIFIDFNIAKRQHIVENVQPLRNAFGIMMAAAKPKWMLPEKQPVERKNGLLKMRNDMVDWLYSLSLGWMNGNANTTGKGFINTLTSVMWGIDCHHGALQTGGVVSHNFLNTSQAIKTQKHTNMQKGAETRGSCAFVAVIISPYRKIIHEGQCLGKS
ncbi:uncharacterized protein LOC117113132 [Anneissia japonica]|uniref:uncharacterized protein LOC117113132 n=1 Tax=Anneissia japonica TaxID=1529436 RepID=UPI0014257AE8|nr:uncharacterized protein LOC117113132 [Anneissia japonica]